MTDHHEPRNDHHLPDTTGQEDDPLGPFDLDFPDLEPNEREELFARVTEHVTERVMTEQFMSWRGRLPRPEHLKAYNDIVPGSAEKIIDEMLTEANVLKQTVAIDERATDRTLTLLEKQEERRLEESRSDRDVRDRSMATINRLLIAMVGMFVLLMLVPLDPWSRSALVAGWIAFTVAPIVIVALRGRHSDNERDVMQKLPDIVRSSVRGELKEMTLRGGKDADDPNGPDL